MVATQIFFSPQKLGKMNILTCACFSDGFGSTTTQVITQPVLTMLLFRSFGLGSFFEAGGVVLSKHVWFFQVCWVTN